ncbi:MAG: monofunctional biosynthetic peptidoglycan transglycosylase [Caldimicrobium sp.]
MKKLKVLLLGIAFLFFLYLFVYPWFIPIDYLKRENPKITAMMKYRMKQWEREGKKIKIKQIWLPLSQVSPYLIKAVLIAEDDNFFKHEGFDFDAIEKAIEANLKAGKIKYGGSTISQQTVKNLFLSPSKNPIRKIHEAFLTYRLERTLSKKRILEIYLNIAEWGEGIFGIEAASRYYFKKSALSLTAWESARLAAVLPNPLKYNPLSNQKYVERRTKIIYNIMKQRNIIKEEYREMENEIYDKDEKTSLSEPTDQSNLTETSKPSSEQTDNAESAPLR